MSRIRSWRDVLPLGMPVRQPLMTFFFYECQGADLIRPFDPHVIQPLFPHIRGTRCHNCLRNPVTSFPICLQHILQGCLQEEGILPSS